MRLFPLILKNVFRKKTRSILTIASILLPLFVICIMGTMILTFDSDPTGGRAMFRLVVRHKVSLTPKNMFARFSVNNPETMMKIFDEAHIVAGSEADWVSDRTGVLVGELLMKKYGWRLGQSGESVVLSLAGGILGVGLFVLFFPGFRAGLAQSPMGGFAAGMRLFPEILALAFGITVAIGILAGVVPAIRSAQRSIPDGLRQVA